MDNVLPVYEIKGLLIDALASIVGSGELAECLQIDARAAVVGRPDGTST